MNSAAAAFLLALSCVFATPALSQDSDVSGTVRDTQGNPLPGIHVVGLHHFPAGGFDDSYATTDDQGRFELQSVGRVVFIRDRRFQPLTYVRRLGETSFTLSLQPGSADRQLPNCPSGKESGKRYGLYLVPRGTKVRHSQHDPDNWRFLVAFPNSKAKETLVVWAGVNVGGGNRAPEDWLLDSSSFAEKWVPGGFDARGKSRDGKNWRYFTSPVDRAFYSGVSDGAVHFFDQIVDSACMGQELVGDPTKQGK